MVENANKVKWTLWGVQILSYVHFWVERVLTKLHVWTQDFLNNGFYIFARQVPLPESYPCGGKPWVQILNTSYSTEFLAILKLKSFDQKLLEPLSYSDLILEKP